MAKIIKDLYVEVIPQTQTYPPQEQYQPLYDPNWEFADYKICALLFVLKDITFDDLYSRIQPQIELKWAEVAPQHYVVYESSAPISYPPGSNRWCTKVEALGENLRQYLCDRIPSEHLISCLTLGLECKRL